MSYSFQSARPRSVRPSPVFFSILGVTAVAGAFVWMATSDTRATRLGVFLFVMGGWLITLCLHEFAHAFLAWKFGDWEVESRGYLTLDPLKYSHPVLSILLPVLFIAIGGIGLPGGAVYIHSHRLRTARQRAIVAGSGPAVNVAFAVVLLIAVRIGAPTSGGFIVTDRPAFWSALSFLALLQIYAAILNMLPVPGFDGYGMVEPYLAPETQRSLEQFKPYGMLVMFLLIFQVPAVGNALGDLVRGLYDLSGTSSTLATLGYTLVKFWTH